MAKCDLSWGDHYSSLLSVFGSYMKNDKLVDVTLAAEGKVIHVHRLVLLASSSYLEVRQFLKLLFTLFFTLLVQGGPRLKVTKFCQYSQKYDIFSLRMLCSIRLIRPVEYDSVFK